MAEPNYSGFSSQSDDEPSDQHEDTRYAAAMIIIDIEGDLVMRLKKGNLKVSRKVLSISSPVFRAMFGAESRFKESTDKELEPDGTQTVSFEEDDFQAMAVIARIMHLQNDNVPDTLTFQQLYQVAILCDKYDLRRCLGYWPILWAIPYLESYQIEGYEGWLFMSIVFGFRGLFKQITKHLILNSKVSPDDSLVTTKGIDVCERVSSTIIDRLIQSRADAMFLVLDLHWQEFCKLRDSKKEGVCLAHSAKCDAVNLGCLLRQFPSLDDPRRTPPSRDETVNSIVVGSEHILCMTLNNPFDHGICNVGPRLTAAAKALLEESVHGLEPGS